MIICRWVIALLHKVTKPIFLLPQKEQSWHSACRINFILPVYITDYRLSFSSNVSQTPAHVGLYTEKWIVWNNDISINK